MALVKFPFWIAVALLALAVRLLRALLFALILFCLGLAWVLMPSGHRAGIAAVIAAAFGIERAAEAPQAPEDEPQWEEVFEFVPFEVPVLATPPAPVRPAHHRVKPSVQQYYTQFNW